MPRKPVVSRTITVSCITAMVADEERRQIVNKEYTIFKKCKTDKQYLLLCQAQETNEDIKVLRVVEKRYRKLLCKQPIQKFINDSEKIYLN